MHEVAQRANEEVSLHNQPGKILRNFRKSNKMQKKNLAT